MKKIIFTILLLPSILLLQAQQLKLNRLLVERYART